MMKRLNVLCLAAALACATGPSPAATPATFSVDGRGLPNVEGILRESSKAGYGFVNFVAFGPGWAYTAQDYAAKEHRKEAVEDPKLGRGLLFTGKIWAGSSGLSIREEFYDVSGGGSARAHVRWTISSLDGGAMNLERAYVRFPLSRAEFAGGRAGDGALPEEYGREWIGVGDKSDVRVVSRDGAKTLRLSVAKGSPVVQDARKDRQDRFELRIDFPDAKTAKSSTVEFEVEGAFADSLRRAPGKVRLDVPPPPVKTVAGDDWCVFPFTNEIVPGSILDFSEAVPRHVPAGRYGFAKVTKDGHFCFERNARPMRFVGGNLCFDANFLTKEQCRAAVRDFVLRGWNTIRLHHVDVVVTKDGWNDLWGRTTYPEISPARLDQLDYLLAECRKSGVYVTFDLYAMGSYGSCEGFDRPLNSNTIKAAVPIHRPAEDLWFRRSMEIFNHVNPYTGVAWKDEPAVLFVTLLNEDSIATVWWGAAEKYVAEYNRWAEAKGYPAYGQKDIGAKREFAEFLLTVKAEANRRMTKRLRDAGVRALVSGGNWWDTMQQAYEREALEVVDNHGYGDHPQPSYQKLPFHVNQTPNAKAGNPTYMEPIMKAPTRILGKPFTVTEYNYCPPNRYRADGGVMMGAYAALQDWDGLYRFAWSHSNANMFTPSRLEGFDIVTDPIGQFTERQIVLMFGRGDVRKAESIVAYGVTKAEAFERGLGDMWARGLFPHAFTHQALKHRIGSFVADGGAQPALACKNAWTAATAKAIPQHGGVAQSDTHEIVHDTRKGRIAVNAPRTAAVCAVDGADLAAGPLAVSRATTFCSVSASSMDGRTLAESRRVLLLHLTDVRNTGMTFTDERCTDLMSWGSLPYLAKTGSAEISLRNANKDLKVYAVGASGLRLRTVPFRRAGEAYRFTAKISPGEGKDAPVMAYELGE